MASYDNEEYEGVIRRNALRAFKKLQEEDPQKWSYTDRTRNEVISKYDNFLNKLRTWMPRDKMTRGYEYALNDYPADSLLAWLEGSNGAKAPDEYEGQTEASKILPLLAGIAKENEDWYSMDSKSLQNEAKRLGYNTNIPGAYQEFLNLVRDYQTQYDRAKLLKEGQQGANYWLNKLFYPSYTQEIENAVLTGQGGDEETLKKLHRLDYATNGIMAAAPMLSFGKAVNPLLMGTIDAGIQGAAEGARQYGLEQMSQTGQKADYLAPILATFTSGATRPAMSATAGGAVTQLQGQFAKDAARGFQKGARTGIPSEEAEVKSAINLFNKELAPEFNNGERFVYDKTGKYSQAYKAPKMAEAFGVKYRGGDHTIDTERILEYYKAPTKSPWYIAPDGTRSMREKTQIVTNNGKVKEVRLGEDTYDLYKSLFPQKVAEMDANQVAKNLGQVAGYGVTQVGGRVEPMAKANPLNVVDRESEQKRYTESYKNQPWYKKLNVESKKIIDEAFKKKDEEETEED
jgi:hypothetical protein